MRERKGQVTVFIIVAIIIIAIIALIYFLFPQIRVNFGFTTDDPNEFMQNCIEEKLESVVETVSIQGGSLEPENYFLYQDQMIEYLCYTNEYYVTCVVQQPFLKQHIERGLGKGVKEESEACLDSLEQSFESQGFDVSLNKEDAKVELFPNRIQVSYEVDLALTRDETERYKTIEVSINNNLYELISIAMSIIETEVTYGDSETTIYMNYYHDLKVEKNKQSDGTTIYVLTNRDTNDKFQFASRSLAWPPGITT